MEYYIDVTYVAPKDVGYLEVPPGQTLTVVADGETIKLEGNGSFNRRRAYRQDKQEFVSEKALYDVTKAQLQKLANAKKVKVQIKGNGGIVDRDFVPENFEQLRAFVTRSAL